MIARGIMAQRIPSLWIWDPCAGTGSIVSVATGSGFNCLGTDTHPRGFGVKPIDFLSPWAPLDFPNIMTNPPPSKLKDVIFKASAVAAYTATFLVDITDLDFEYLASLAHPHGLQFRSYFPFTYPIELTKDAEKMDIESGKVLPGPRFYAWVSYRDKKTPFTHKLIDNRYDLMLE